MLEGVSRRTFGGSSGTYNVRASELAHDRGRLKTLHANVVFLDNSQNVFQISKSAKGQVLLEAVFQHLELVEKDYFGLQFSEDGMIPSPGNSDLIKWLDPQKPIKRQTSGTNFYFRVKFYVSDPSKLQEEYTRYHFYLQVRKDILQGRLLVSPQTACLLASYTLQSELGDFQEETESLCGMVLIPGQTEEMEKKIIELHKLHKGQTPADAEFNFLDHAKKLEMYGVDLHRARDSANKELQIGIAATGMVVFQNNVRINLFSWTKIVKISFKRKQFFLQLRREPSENYDTLLGFNMLTYRSAKKLWKSCVEHHSFFRLYSPLRSRMFCHNPLNLGSSFRYSGRTELQTMQEGRRTRASQTIIRASSRSHSHQLALVAIEENNTGGRTSRSHENNRTATSTITWEFRSSSNWRESSTHRLSDDSEGGFLDRSNASQELERSVAFSPVLPPRSTICYVDDDAATDSERTTPGSLYDLRNYSGQSSQGEENVVSMKIKPDEQGRYGFNVKGGSDINMPILVSRVAPNTPADRTYPKLNEGDQVLMINGCDISKFQHDQVVALIRSASNFGGELLLTVKQNTLYEPGDHEEPPYQYVPESPLSTVKKGSGAGALEQSMLLLADGLASGALVAQFEQLYRKKPGLTCNESKKPENVNKNRYRDISPYDLTRVILVNGSDGDYINANHINMEIPGSGIVNRYIATQGPLQSTIVDFYQMVFEAQSTLIIMVTTLSEKGRSKCVKYWPSLSETIDIGTRFTLTNTKEEMDFSNSFVLREFTFKDKKTGESRDITQMQYLAWPDHGVPDDISRFLQFSESVRRARSGMVEPTIVHCSAGIGRTGVLILMETAMCLIEANEPVYPLDIVKQMRDQRAMMIQTPSQYRFVCSCIHYTYSEGLVKPLPEFIK